MANSGVRCAVLPDRAGSSSTRHCGCKKNATSKAKRSSATPGCAKNSPHGVTMHRYLRAGLRRGLRMHLCIRYSRCSKTWSAPTRTFLLSVRPSRASRKKASPTASAIPTPSRSSWSRVIVASFCSSWAGCGYACHDPCWASCATLR